jgi:hypothetical protein
LTQFIRFENYAPEENAFGEAEADYLGGPAEPGDYLIFRIPRSALNKDPLCGAAPHLPLTGGEVPVAIVPRHLKPYHFKTSHMRAVLQ